MEHFSSPSSFSSSIIGKWNKHENRDPSINIITIAKYSDGKWEREKNFEVNAQEKHETNKTLLNHWNEAKKKSVSFQ